MNPAILEVLANFLVDTQPLTWHEAMHIIHELSADQLIVLLQKVYQ
jgi:hypothetical protein